MRIRRKEAGLDPMLAPLHIRPCIKHNFLLIVGIKNEQNLHCEKT